MESDLDSDLVLPLLRRRWSPRVWDAHHEIGQAQLDALIEAARWAPSAGHSQPWSFIVAPRGSADHDLIVTRLAGSSRRWAPDAGALVVTLCQQHVEGTDWDYCDYAAYDLGQAVAHLTIQAQSMGLHTRQFAAFDHDGLATDFEVPGHRVVTTMVAVGTVPPGVAAESPPAYAGPEVRERRHADDLLWTRPSVRAPGKPRAPRPPAG